jgi:hypothetical protein
LWLAVGAALLLPLILMQLTTQVSWNALDFAAATVLLVSAGAGLELIARSRISQM